MTRIKRHTGRFTLAASLAGLACAAIAGAQMRPALPEAFTATAVNMSGIGSTVPTALDITITRWTSTAEQERYISILRDKGGDALAEALRRGPSIGSILHAGKPGVRFPLRRPGAHAQQRTAHHPAGGSSPRVRRDDRSLALARLSFLSAIGCCSTTGCGGKGSLWIAAKLTLLDDLLIVDNYADRPVTLNDVRRITAPR